ncbi:hypothetical protein ACI8AF_14405 [Blastococcus sp. SYSU D00669]
MTAAVDLRTSSTPSVPDRTAVSAAARSHKGFPGVEVATRPVALHRLPVSIDREADGTYLVSDHEDQVVGTGSTLSEALNDFRAALQQHVAYLRANRERLHQRLLHDLLRLEHDFPWV